MEGFEVDGHEPIMFNAIQQTLRMLMNFSVFLYVRAWKEEGEEKCSCSEMTILMRDLVDHHVTPQYGTWINTVATGQWPTSSAPAPAIITT